MASKKIMAILDALDKEYGTDYVCYLNHRMHGSYLLRRCSVHSARMPE